jgi:hypothetical protein
VITARESAEGDLRFKAVCSWCGAVIRRTSARDSRGMCLKCYALMLREHTRVREDERPRWANER